MDWSCSFFRDFATPRHESSKQTAHVFEELFSLYRIRLNSRSPPTLHHCTARLSTAPAPKTFVPACLLKQWLTHELCVPDSSLFPTVQQPCSPLSAFNFDLSTGKESVIRRVMDSPGFVVNPLGLPSRHRTLICFAADWLWFYYETVTRTFLLSRENVCRVEFLGKKERSSISSWE